MLSARMAMQIIWILSLLATLGSLYIGYWGDPFLNIQSGWRFNRLNGIVPCDICWYMRVVQYPLLIISGLALRYKEYRYSTLYMAPMAAICLVLGLYKRGLEMGWIAESTICISGVSCSTPTLLGGFLSLPLLGAGIALLILLCCFSIRRSTQNDG